MSGCRNGGRDVYRRPDSWTYEQGEPIRASMVFTDGTSYEFSCSRMTKDGPRELSHFESDGIRYEPISRTQSPETGTESKGTQAGAQERRERQQD